MHSLCAGYHSACLGTGKHRMLRANITSGSRGRSSPGRWHDRRDTSFRVSRKVQGELGSFTRRSAWVGGNVKENSKSRKER